MPSGAPRGRVDELLGAAAIPPEAAGDQQEQAEPEQEAAFPLQARLADDVGDRSVGHGELQHIHGVDVDDPGDVVGRLQADGGPGHDGPQLVAVGAVHLEVPAEPVAEAGDRRRGGPQHADVRHPIRCSSQSLDEVPRPLGRRPVVDAANHHPHDAAVGRIEQGLAGGQFATDKGLVVMGRGGANRGMVGRAGLDHYPAAERPAATAARHLRIRIAPLSGRRSTFHTAPLAALHLLLAR